MLLWSAEMFIQMPSDSHIVHLATILHISSFSQQDSNGLCKNCSGRAQWPRQRVWGSIANIPVRDTSAYSHVLCACPDLSNLFRFVIILWLTVYRESTREKTHSLLLLCGSHRLLAAPRVTEKLSTASGRHWPEDRCGGRTGEEDWQGLTLQNVL